MEGIVFLDLLRLRGGDKAFVIEVMASGPQMATFARSLKHEIPDDQRDYYAPGLGESPRWTFVRRAIPTLLRLIQTAGLRLEIVAGGAERELRKIEKEQARRTTDPRKGAGRRGKRSPRPPPSSSTWGGPSPARCPYPHDEAFESMYLTSNAPEDVAKAVYKVLCLRNHPDRGGSEDRMKKLNATWDGIRAKRGWG